MSQRLENRVAIVTGGTGALGRAVVRRLIAAGARVHVTWRTEAEVSDLQQYLGREAPKVALHEADLTRETRMREVVNEVVKEDGRLDILGNVAGGFAMASLDDTKPELWERMHAVNATTAFVACRVAARHMRERRYGRIVNVSAAPALGRGAANMTAYAAAKAAVLSLTYSLAKELGPDGITVNAIVPSILDTPQNREAMPDADRSGWLPLDDVAEVVGFLVSDAAGIVTATAVNLERHRPERGS